METEKTEGGLSAAKAVHFLRECREELTKVVKPTREETFRATGVTIFILVFIALTLTVFDLAFNWLMRGMFGV